MRSLFVNQKTAYEMLISDWSSDVCASDLAEVGVERFVFGLDPLAVQQVVLRLFHGRRLETTRARGLVRLADLFGRPLGRAPIQHLALADQRVHGRHGF